MHHLAVPPVELLIAVMAAAIIALLARQMELLSSSGTVGAITLGTLLVATGDWWLGILLITFFITSSLLPSSDRSRPERDWRQVLANGGPALAFATIAVLTQNHAWYLGSAATIAAAASDTWATELGKRYGGTPTSLTGQHVPPGTSGAVTGAGLVASVAGAALIAVSATLLQATGPTFTTDSLATFSIVAIGGIAGSILDTLLGGTVQARFRCSICAMLTESPEPHQPGHLVKPIFGIPWLTNSMVNLIATCFAGLLAATVALLLP